MSRGMSCSGGGPVALLPPSNLAVRGRIFTSRPPATRHTHTCTDRPPDRRTNQTHRHTDVQKDRQTETQTSFQTHTGRCHVTPSTQVTNSQADMYSISMLMKVHRSHVDGGIAASCVTSCPCLGTLDRYQHSTAQHSTAWHSTARHGTA